jgi:hypothetical protein
VNIDGVQWFKSSKVKGTPILGSIFSISKKGQPDVKIPNSKPFIIGVLKHTVKPDTSDFLQDLIEELEELQPDNRQGDSFAVKLKCFCCDAVGRCELKGICNFGYFR